MKYAILLALVALAAGCGETKPTPPAAAAKAGALPPEADLDSETATRMYQKNKAKK